jgi:hypothetical protein
MNVKLPKKIETEKCHVKQYSFSRDQGNSVKKSMLLFRLG